MSFCNKSPHGFLRRMHLSDTNLHVKPIVPHQGQLISAQQLMCLRPLEINCVSCVWRWQTSLTDVCPHQFLNSRRVFIVTVFIYLFFKAEQWLKLALTTRKFIRAADLDFACWVCSMNKIASMGKKQHSLHRPADEYYQEAFVA